MSICRQMEITTANNDTVVQYFIFAATLTVGLVLERCNRRRNSIQCKSNENDNCAHNQRKRLWSNCGADERGTKIDSSTEGKMGNRVSIVCGRNEEESKPKGFTEFGSNGIYGSFTDSLGSHPSDRLSSFVVSQQIVDRECQIRVHSRCKQQRKKICCQAIRLSAEFDPPVHPKSDDVVKFIDSCLTTNFVFASLEVAERKRLIDAMQMELVSEDSVIIEQNTIGDYFYVLEEGLVNFIVDGSNVGSCRRGGSFGELALLYDCPRAATCRAANDCRLWKVDQITFKQILARRAQSDEKDTNFILSKVPFLAELEDSLKRQLCDAMTRVNFSAGERIVRKGEEGNVFYIVKDGSVKIHDIGLGQSRFEDRILNPGDWFGERALVTGEPRAANVTAVSDVATLAISRETFRECFGSLNSLIKLESKKQFLKSVPFFATTEFQAFEIDQLARLADEICFKEGHKLLERGKPVEKILYMITEGSILVAGPGTRLVKLGRGDYMGAKWLDAPDDRMSDQDVTVEENLTCWYLTRADVVRVIGDLGRLGEAAPYVINKPDPKIRMGDLKKHRILGMGSFGKVWLVTHDVSLGVDAPITNESREGKLKPQVYALKVLNKFQLVRDNQVASVIRERDVMASIEHPFIMNLVSSFQDTDRLYFLLELVQGGELFNVIHTETGSGLSEKDALFYCACIIEAFGHLHSRNIVYRDLKPENILMDGTGYCVVGDMGFAKVVVDKTYTLCGTPEYLAPEVILSKGHDRAVDYWSFGVLVYECLIGRTPFFSEGTDATMLFKKIVMGRYRAPDDMPKNAKEMVDRLLVRKPSNRLGKLAGGFMDIKNHPWFSSKIDFKKLRAKDIDAPWIPDIQDPLDSSHFQDFKDAEEDGHLMPPLSTQKQDMFKDF